mmetsp:Transcript_67640/g.180812  ORF Transcript_67640/g.180812 Transcript_67640/m.180812 type:complete len:832 (+) Transcript_67640:357-2852(+)
MLSKSLGLWTFFLSYDALEQFQREFKQMEANFIITNILYQKFKKVAGSMFVADQESQTPIAPILKAAWALFLYFREEFKCYDLIRGFYLLVASLYHVICAVPERIAPSFPVRTKLGSAVDPSMRSNILDALGTMQNYNASQLADQNRIFENLVSRIGSFVEDGSLRGDPCEGHAIFCAGYLEKNTEFLVRMVRSKQRPRDIDGFIVIEHPNIIGEVSKGSDGHRPESSPTKRAPVSAVSPVRTAVAALPSRSPVSQRNAMFRTPERPAGVMRPLAPPMTPITAALHENAWISGYVSSESAELDEVLHRFLGACPQNPEAEIVSRLEGCSERLRERVSGDVLVVGKKLYLKSLRCILLKEEQRLQISNFSNLLHDDVMHRALLAICHEIVFQTHLGSKNAGDLGYLLSAFGINDFEFLLMTENFLRDFELELPSDIRRHILQLLHKIVDQDAWSCQPLLNLLEQSSVSVYFTSVIDSLQPVVAGVGSHHLSDAGASHGHRSVAESPLIVRAPRLPRIPQQTEPAVPQAETTGPQSTNDRETERQVHKQVLAFGRRFWHRISDVTITLYKALKQSAGMNRPSFDRSMRVIKTIATTPAMRELLHRRHLHQVIMCVVFGSCKAEKDNEVTFKKIIQEHKFNFDANDELYWNVLLGPNQDQTGNIIEFYNTRFIPICKQVLLDDSDNENQTDPALSPVRRPAMIPASPTTPKRYARNVTVSPYRHERCQFEMTPRTSRLLAVENDGITHVDARNTQGDSVLRKRTREELGGCEHFPRENIMQFLRSQLHQADQSQPESVALGGAVAVQPTDTDPAEADTRPSGTEDVPTLVNKGV